ncbi:MAG: hypothetical protein C0407_13115, partial [Desulfobacca sp.]|nr:hypothetical protein [Desulfobacca sp.]
MGRLNRSSDSTAKVLLGFPDFHHFVTRPGILLILALMIGLLVGDSFTPPYPWFWPYIFFSLLVTLPLAILFVPALSLWTGCGFFLVTGLSLLTFLSPQVNA